MGNGKSIKVILDSDVIIHFIKGGCLNLLPKILPMYSFVILNMVYDHELAAAHRVIIQNTVNFLKTITIEKWEPLKIELDDAFFTSKVPEDQKDKPRKRGRDSQNKTKVPVMCESTPRDTPKKGRKDKKAGHLKMKVIPDLKSATIISVVKERVDGESDLTTDDSTSYVDLEQLVNSHTSQAVKPEEVEKVLSCVHTAISNVKRLLLDVHHNKLKPEYLQYYLNEFCYKFIRRFFLEKLFDRLVIAAVSYSPDFKSKIYNRSYCG